MNHDDKPYAVCVDCEDDEGHYQEISRHSSHAAAERAARRFEAETGRDTWVEPDKDE